jgi:hypothetical protein
VTPVWWSDARFRAFRPSSAEGLARRAAAVVESGCHQSRNCQSPSRMARMAHGSSAAVSRRTYWARSEPRYTLPARPVGSGSHPTAGLARQLARRDEGFVYPGRTCTCRRVPRTRKRNSARWDSRLYSAEERTLRLSKRAARGWVPFPASIENRSNLGTPSGSSPVSTCLPFSHRSS